MRLRKSASFTRWDARPLSEEQVGYAREDVLHLLQLADALQDRLRDRGRLEWAREECRALEDASDERDPDAIFDRLPRVNSLDPAQRAVARELVEWREDTAREADRPVPSVLADAALVEIAKRRPQTLERLAQIRGLNEGTLRRRGHAILAAVERGREREPIPVDGVRPPPPDAERRAAHRAGRGARARPRGGGRARLRAASPRAPTCSGSSPRCATGRSEPDVRTLQGWRRELVGDELLELLPGAARCASGPTADRRHRLGSPRSG